MSEPAFRYIVLRAGPGLPEGFLPADMDGRWFDIDKMQPGPLAWFNDAGWSQGVAVATERFERRDDGATARVYEFRI